jgi:multidrug efflux pump subunit AcrB
LTGPITAILQNRVAANLLMIFILVSGIVSISNLSVRLFPETDVGSISVSVPYPGATPGEVETSIVRPIEERLEGLEGVDKITGLAASNVGNITVDIAEGESMSEMLDEIKSEIDRITLFPEEAEEPQVTEIEADELTAQIVIHGEVERELLKQTADRVRAELAASDAMSLVEIGGAPEYLIDVTVNEDALRARNLSLTGIANAIGAQSLDLSAGEIEDSSQLVRVRSVGERRNGEQLEQVVIGSGATSTPILLGDVAEVNDGLADEPVLAVFNGEPATFVTVFRVGQEKQLDVAAAVRDYMDNEISGVLPDGVQATLWRDESVYLQQRIELLTKNAVIGLALVCVLLLAFLDLRIAFWTAIGVGVCFAGVFFPMFLLGISINQLSLFGFILAIGIIVDDAIVVGENIHANWRRGEGPMAAARLGVSRVARPVLFSVSTTICAFVPLLIIPGVFGDFIGDIAVIVILLLVLSLIESFFVLPRHLSHLHEVEPAWWSPRRLADPLRDTVASGLRRFRSGPLKSAVTFVAYRPVMTVMAGFGLFLASLSLITGGVVKSEFFPSIEGEYVTAELELAEGASEVRTIEYAERIAARTRDAAETIGEDGTVQAVLWSLGAPLASGGPEPGSPGGGAAGNKAYIVAKIKDSGVRKFTAAQFERAWRDAVGEIPGAQKLTFTSDLVSPGAPVEILLSARRDADTRAALAEIRTQLESIPGVFDVRDDRFRTTDEVRIQFKPLARDYGLTQADLAREVRAAIFGAEATRIQRDREEIEVRVRLPEEERSSISTLKDLRIPVQDGYIPLGTVADLDIQPAPATINRVNGRAVYSLSAFVNAEVTTADEVMDRLLGEIVPSVAEDYEGLRATLAGDQEQQAEAAPAIQRNFTLALVVIYILLALNFRSYSQPLVIMMAIPFGFMGALIGHALLGLKLSLLSFFGVIGLAGVIINTSLMVTDFLNERLANGEAREEAVINAMLDRFRAILLTTMTTFLGVTPIIFETSVQAQFLIPTAVSLGFGILIGTTVLVLLLPALLVLHLRIFGRSHAEEAESTPQPQIG